MYLDFLNKSLQKCLLIILCFQFASCSTAYQKRMLGSSQIPYQDWGKFLQKATKEKAYVLIKEFSFKEDGSSYVRIYDAYDFEIGSRSFQANLVPAGDLILLYDEDEQELKYKDLSKAQRKKLANACMIVVKTELVAGHQEILYKDVSHAEQYRNNSLDNAFKTISIITATAFVATITVGVVSLIRYFDFW